MGCRHLPGAAERPAWGWAGSAEVPVFLPRLQEVNCKINKRLKDALFTDQWSELFMDVLSPFHFVLVRKNPQGAGFSSPGGGRLGHAQAEPCTERICSGRSGQRGALQSSEQHMEGEGERGTPPACCPAFFTTSSLSGCL